MLYYGYGKISDYTINVGYPHGFRAGDSFIHPSFAEWVKDEGNFLYNPSYGMEGYEGTIEWYPPILPYLTAMFSYLTRINPYNLVFFMMILLTSFAALIMYLIIRNFNKNIALLSLPLMPLLFYRNFYAGFTWGQFGFYIGSFFFLAIFWALTKLELKNSFILLGLFLTGAALAHTSELILGLGFILFYFIILFIVKKLKLKQLKTAIFAIILFAILSIYYLIIFRYTWITGFSSHFTFGITKESEWGAFAIGRMIDFSWLLPFIILGIILILFLVLLQKKTYIAPLVSIYMLLVGFGNYIMLALAHRAFQTRFFWPVYLSLFFGIALYQIIKLFFKKVQNMHFVILSAVILLFFMLSFYEKPAPGGMMDQIRWDSFQWISKNTPEDAKLYFMYGDPYGQTPIFFITKRLSYAVHIRDYIESLNNQTVKRYYLSKNNGGLPYVREGLFKFRLLETPDLVMDLCSFDYYIFDKTGSSPPLVQYNNFIKQMFLNLGWMEIVHSNQLLDVVKNNQPGVNCIGFENRTAQ